jgi:hypothetical protein
VARLRILSTPQKMAVVVAAVFYIAAYWRIMPPYLLWHAALVRIGVF